MISITDLSKKFGNIRALDNISLKIQEGEFYGLLGPNGAGKTTTINILSSLLKPDDGQVEINGINLLANPGKCKLLLGVVPQELALYDSLTARENLKFWGKIFGLKGSGLNRRVDELLEMMTLTKRKNDKVSEFSGGMKRRINLAVALIHNPNILLLDEPTVGIDIQSRYRIYDILKELNKSGMTIIYTTHYMEEVERLCSRLAIIDHGVIKAEGSLSQLQEKMPARQSVTFVLTPDFRKNPPGTESPLPDGLTLNDDGLCGAGTVNDLLATMTTVCSTRNWSVQDIQIHSNSLESVFLDLTGHEIRD